MTTSETATSVRTATKFHGGLDLVTVIGVALVTLEHYLDLIDRQLMMPPGMLILGPVGVFIFLLMSGYHSALSRHPPGEWLRRRLVRIYPSLWIVLCVAFPAAAWSGAQTFDAWQVLAQFSGFGFFTHSESLVLKPTWFLSPLLVCYGLVFLMRLTGRPHQLSVAALILSAWLLLNDSFSWTYLSFLAFWIGYCLAAIVPEKFQSPALFVVGTAILAVTPVQSHLPKEGLACFVVAGGLLMQRPIPGVRLLAERSYEFYLVHGLAFYGALRVLDLNPALGGIVATLGSLILAELLYRVVRAIPGWSRKIASLRHVQGIRSSHPPVLP